MANDDVFGGLPPLPAGFEALDPGLPDIGQMPSIPPLSAPEPPPPVRAEPTAIPTTFKSSAAPELAAILDDLSRQYGVDRGTLDAFGRIESSHNPRNRTGSYKGWFQLSDSEFSKYGGQGDIFDPVENASAAARKLKAESAHFERRYGRQPTASELYLIHQQGEGGADQHWANPDAPAWQNMHATGEGQQKGANWAKRAIWGNMPPEARRQFGSVNNVTSRDFVNIWDNKVNRFGGAATPASPPPAASEMDAAPVAPAPGGESLTPTAGALPPLPKGYTELPPAAASAAGLPPLPKGYTWIDDPAKSSPTTFAGSIGRGVDQMQGMLYGGVEALGEATGSKTLTDFGREGRVRNDQEAKAYGDPAEFTKIRSAGDFGQWVKETVGSQIPVMGPMLAGGIAGSMVGGPIGGVLGAFAPGFLMSTGETQGNIKEKDPNAVAPSSAFVGGAAIAALDSVLPGKIGSSLVRRFGADAAEEIAKRALSKPVKESALKVGAKGAVMGMATEGVTEALQEAIGDVAAAYGTGKGLDPNLGTKMIEAGAAGGLMGGLMGPLGGHKAQSPLSGTVPPPPIPGQPGTTAEGTPSADVTPNPIASLPRVADAPVGRVAATPSPAAPPEQATAASSGLVPPPAPQATPEEAAILQQMGYSPIDIAEMSREEISSELADASAQGLAGPTSVAKDAPSAEPVADLAAQLEDLKAGTRQGVYLSPDNLANATSQPDVLSTLASDLAAVDGAQLVPNVDGKGGLLIAKKPEADAARAALTGGATPEQVLGAMTGSGQGKVPGADTVVQQRTPDGAVTRETLVPAAEAPAAAAAMAAPGRTVETMPAEDAIARREEQIAAEKAAPTQMVGNSPELPTTSRPEAVLAPTPQGDGTRQAPIKVELPEDVAVAGQRVAQPTDAQKEANNYRHGHIKLHGLDIAIENPKGSTRSGTSPDGSTWSVEMPAAYGYVKRTRGADQDQIDVYIGEDPASDRVWVVDQVDAKTGRFDEHKSMLAFSDRESALAAYTAAFSDGKGADRIGAVTEMAAPQFRNWVREGQQTKPLGEIRKPAARKPARNASSSPANALSFIRSAGGIQPDADLRQILDKQRIPGLFNRNGMTPDDMLRALTEQNFIQDRSGGNVLETSLQDLYDLVGRIAAGERVGPFGETIERPKSAKEIAEQAHREIINEAQSVAQDVGARYDLTASEESRLVSLVNDEYMSVEDALERVAIESIENEAAADDAEGSSTQGPIDGADIEPGAQGSADEPGEALGRPAGAQGGEPNAGGGAAAKPRAAGDGSAGADARSGADGRSGDVVKAPSPGPSDSGLGRVPTFADAKALFDGRFSEIRDYLDSKSWSGWAKLTDEQRTRAYNDLRKVAGSAPAVDPLVPGEPLAAASTDEDAKPAAEPAPQAESAAPKASSQTSLVPEATTAEKIDAETRAKSEKGKSATNETGPLFNPDAGKQTDLVDIAKAPAEPVKSPDSPKAETADTVAEEAAKEADIDALFDEVVSNQFAAKPESRPESPARASRKKAAIATKSAATNVARGLDEVASGLTALFGNKPGRLGSGVSFDEETYRKAVPFFQAGAAHFQQAGADIRTAMRELIRYLAETAGMSQDAIVQMKPYVVRFVRDVRDGTIDGENRAPGRDAGVERDWRDGPAQDGLGEADVSAPAKRDGKSPRSRAGAPEQGGSARGGRRIPARDASVVGERGDRQVQEGAPGNDGRPAERGERAGGGDAGIDRVPPGQAPTAKVGETASNGTSLARAVEAQKKADATVRFVPNDEANIRDSLPLLKPAQQDDVIKAEARFSKPDGHGYLFTNGTGTGKTFTGLGVIKRFVAQGKFNILVVAPSQGILDGWIASSKMIGLDVARLVDTKSAGTGIVATTYANLRGNTALADRDWDLLVADEAHHLSQEESGDPSEALTALRGLSGHRPGARAAMKLTPLRNEIRALEAARSEQSAGALADLRKEYGRRFAELSAEHAAKPRAKTLFLSATPFAYRKSTDWAEGFLFDYPDREGGYNNPGGRDEFLVRNFGYAMRYNRAEEPGPEVNVGVLEREFYERLKRAGVLSGRRLDVEADYDRRFVLVDEAVGAKIDQALDWLWMEGAGRYADLREMFMEQFNYLSQRRLLEAIKAKHAIPRIKRDIELGRKVVVFHDYNEGGGLNPFAPPPNPNKRARAKYGEPPNEAPTYGTLYNEFVRANPYIKRLDFSQFRDPITTLTEAFPGALVYNGRIPNKKRAFARDAFNRDGSGRDIIIVQSAAGEAGISLHDTSGQHQRVLYNLGLPTRPTTAIQQEGRIYREGQVSDAIIRYMSTGTNWERSAFAQTIAERASTAENLALGDEARALRESFIHSFNDADEIEQGATEGKGGKAQDRTMGGSMSVFERAKTFYYAEGKKRGRRDQREGNDYFPTPEPIGLKMVELADVGLGERVLEPSAGHGAIARWLPEGANRFLIEPSPSLASRAGLASPGAKVITGRFEDHYIGNKYDAIVMNPPFGTGGKVAFEHIQKAVGHLRDGGRVVAVVPRGGMADRRFEAFRESDANESIVVAMDVALPPVMFERAGTKVATRLLVLEKRSSDSDVPAPSHINLSDVDTIKDLFDRIEPLSLGSRKRPASGQAATPPTVEVAEEPAPTTAPATAGVQFKLAEAKHSKTGATLHVASIAQFVERAVYDRLRETAKKHGGYYSTFKGAGAVPGFQFSTEATRAAFLQEAMTGADPSLRSVSEVARSGKTVSRLDYLKGRILLRQPADLTRDADRVLEIMRAEPAALPDSIPEAVVTKLEPVKGRAGQYLVTARDRNGAEYSYQDDGALIPKTQGLYLLLDGRPAVVLLPLDFSGSLVEGIGAVRAHEAVHALRVNGFLPGDGRDLASGWGRLVGHADSLGVLKMSRAELYGRMKDPRAATASKTVATLDVYQKLYADHSDAREMLDQEAVAHMVEVYKRGGWTEQEVAPIKADLDDILSGRVSRQDRSELSLDMLRSVQDERNVSKAVDRAVADAVAIVTRIAGPGIDIRVAPTISLADANIGPEQIQAAAKVVGGMENLPSTVAGYYDGPGKTLNARAVIALAYADPTFDVRTAAGHEAYHHVEAVLASPQELRLLNAPSEMARMTRHAAAEMGFTVEETARYTPSEIRAVAFQRYRRLREEGGDMHPVHIGIRRIWDRMVRMFQSTRNALKGQGFDSYESIFERARTGQTAREHAERRAAVSAPTEASPSDGTPAASIFPTATSPGTSAGRWVAATMRRMSPRSDQWRVRLQDRFLMMRRQQEAIESQTGTQLPLTTDVYTAESLYHGRAGERAADFQQRRVEPLVEHLRQHEITAEEFGDYLYARHAKERNAYIRTIDPTNTAGSGMTDADAGAITGRVESGPKATAYAEAAAMIDRINKETRDTLLASGLISREVYDAWSSDYQHYVPLRGFEANDEEMVFPRVGRGLNIRGPEALRALGRRSEADNPLAYVLLQAQQANVRAEKNRVMKTLMRLVQNNPDPEVWEIYRGEWRRRLNETTGLIEQYWVAPQFSANDPSIVGVKVGGKQHYIQLHNPNLARALKGVGGSEFDHAIVRAMMTVTRTYAQLLTSWNPEFIVGNFFRDGSAGLLNSKDVADLPAGARKKMLADALSLKSIRGIYNALRGDQSHPYAHYFEEFRLAGGKVSFMEFNDVERIKKRINGALTAGKTRRAIQAAAKYVEDLNTSVENAFRLSTFIAMREAGIAQDRAASVARELTVNFNRKGEWGPIINSAYMFFNASVQGSTRMVQAMARSKAVRRAVLAIVAGGFALEILNYMVSGDDDDKENAYDKIKPWLKERNMIFMLPGRKDYVMIPMPYGYNVPFVAGQKVGELVRSAFGAGKMTPAKAAAGIMSALMDSFNPLGTSPTTSFLQMASPTILDPVVQVAENKTWNGNPIYPVKYDRRKPDSESYFASVHPFFIDMAKVLNSATGGNAAKPGNVDLSPEVLEHYAQFLGGGVAKFLLNMSGTAQRALSGEDWVPEKTPILRRVYGAQGATSRRQDFYEQYQKVDAAFYEMQQLAKAGDREGVQRVRTENAAEIAAYGAMHGTQRALSKFAKERGQTQLNRSLSDAEKTTKLNEIKDRENALILKALETYYRAQRDKR